MVWRRPSRSPRSSFSKSGWLIMSEIKIVIKNLPEIKAALRKAPAEMVKNLNQAIRKTIFLVEGKSQAKVPFRTGSLQKSAYRDFSPLRGEFGYTVTHGVFVHD